MCVVIQICSGRYHPVDEAVLNEWNKARNADSGRGERSCDTDPNGDVRFEHLACKELRRFTKAGSVIGLKGLIDKFGDSDRAVYRAWVNFRTIRTTALPSHALSSGEKMKGYTYHLRREETRVAFTSCS